MANNSFRDGHTLWKVLRIKSTFVDDDDWVGDVSDGVPDDADCASVPFYFPGNAGKNTSVEFVVIPYTAATGLVVDSTATYTYEPVFVHDLSEGKRPAGTGLRGQTAGNASAIATRKAGEALVPFNQHRRFTCDGADKFTIRLTTFSATPAGADEMEIWYRCVVE